jgi:hypothetical protein
MKYHIKQTPQCFFLLTDHLCCWAFLIFCNTACISSLFFFPLKCVPNWKKSQIIKHYFILHIPKFILLRAKWSIFQIFLRFQSSAGAAFGRPNKILVAFGDLATVHFRHWQRSKYLSKRNIRYSRTWYVISHEILQVADDWNLRNIWKIDHLTLSKINFGICRMK